MFGTLATKTVDNRGRYPGGTGPHIVQEHGPMFATEAEAEEHIVAHAVCPIDGPITWRVLTADETAAYLDEERQIWAEDTARREEFKRNRHLHFRAAPMTGSDWDNAWDTGPGSEP